jgi:hypothetical protein
LLLLRLLPAVAAAMSVGQTARAEGIPLGPFEFYPSVSVETGIDGNVFNRDEGLGVVEDEYAYIRTPLQWRLPFLNSRWDFAYTPGWNGYHQNTELDGMTHEVDTELELNFSTGARFLLGGAGLSDYLNTQAYSEGEVAFSAQRYKLWTLALDYEHPFNARHGFQVKFDAERLRFEENAFNTFPDRNLNEIGLFYLTYVGRQTTVFVDAVIGRNEQERVDFQTDEGRWDEEGIQAGLRRKFNERDRAEVFAGYDRLTFENSEDSHFSGIVGRFTYDRRVTASIALRAELMRKPYPSVYNVNNYYLTDRVAAFLGFEPPGRLFYVLTVSFQRNAYPDETLQFCPGETEPEPPGVTSCGADPGLFPDDAIGIQRLDQLLSGSAGIGIQFARTSALELTYAYAYRDSNVPGLGYETPQLYLTFRFGWAPDREKI